MYMYSGYSCSGYSGCSGFSYCFSCGVRRLQLGEDAVDELLPASAPPDDGTIRSETIIGAALRGPNNHIAVGKGAPQRQGARLEGDLAVVVRVGVRHRLGHHRRHGDWHHTTNMLILVTHGLKWFSMVGR